MLLGRREYLLPHISFGPNRESSPGYPLNYVSVPPSFLPKGTEMFYKGSGQDHVLTHNFIKQHSHRKLYGKFEFIQLEGADKGGLRHNHALDGFQHPLSQSIGVMTL